MPQGKFLKKNCGKSKQIRLIKKSTDAVPGFSRLTELALFFLFFFFIFLPYLLFHPLFCNPGMLAVQAPPRTLANQDKK
jgi:hypothetical protein